MRPVMDTPRASAMPLVLALAPGCAPPDLMVSLSVDDFAVSDEGRQIR